jgi:hypothetical protein
MLRPRSKSTLSPNADGLTLSEFVILRLKNASPRAGNRPSAISKKASNASALPCSATANAI